MDKKKLLEELEKLILKQENDVMSKGENFEILSRINILQSKIQTIQLIENSEYTSQILKNNKKTSKSTFFLSLLTIILSVISLYNALFSDQTVYKKEFDRLIELQTEEINENREFNSMIESLIKKDTLR